MKNQIAYGLDLAGFKSAKSALAKARREGRNVTVTLFTEHPFLEKKSGADKIDEQIEKERTTLQKLTPMYVDAPIDLQDLPTPKEYSYTWQLTKRAVDFAFAGLCPLADKIGTPVARIQNILCEIDPDPLGDWLFETYPKASLCNYYGPDDPVPKYKNQKANFSAGTWNGDEGLRGMLNKLNVQAPEAMELNDDEFDAMICALTGLVDPDHRLEGDELVREIKERIKKVDKKADMESLAIQAPKGYVLFHTLSFDSIRVSAKEAYQPGLASS